MSEERISETSAFSFSEAMLSNKILLFLLFLFNVLYFLVAMKYAFVATLFKIASNKVLLKSF